MKQIKLFEIYSNYRTQPTEYKSGQIPWTYEPEERPTIYSPDGMLMNQDALSAWFAWKLKKNPGMSIEELDDKIIKKYDLDIDFNRIRDIPQKLYVCLKTNDKGQAIYTYFFGVSEQEDKKTY